MADKETSPLIALRVPAQMLAEIDRLARTKYVSRSDVVRDALRTLLRGQAAADIPSLAVDGLNENQGEAA
jgi:Arc/MetJ-type ribon-helix-helix transcriptional regulator